MTYIEYVAVEGFKGVEQLRFESGKINLITGRNNSGKTSLLEAVDLAFYPTHIRRFGQDLDTVVRQGHDSSHIIVEAGGSTRELRIAEPDVERVPDLMLDVLRQRIQRMIVSRSEISNEVPDEEIIGIINSEIPEITTRYFSESNINGFKDEMIILNLDGEEYPYVHFGDEIMEIYREIYIEINKKIVSGYNISEDQTQLDDFNVSLLTFSLHGSGEFVGQEPSEAPGVKFIREVQNDAPNISDEDKDPVKIDDIGEYLRKNNLVDDLKTFDIDYLVFENDDGEKYSVPFDYMGDGFKSLVNILWELMEDQDLDDIIMVEEPETHMHPGYVRELIYFIIQISKYDGAQFFITTHNNDFLNDFFTENLKEDERQFLEDEFCLIQLQDGVADVMSYEESEEHLKDLKLDLRGI